MRRRADGAQWATLDSMILRVIERRWGHLRRAVVDTWHFSVGRLVVGLIVALGGVLVRSWRSSPGELDVGDLLLAAVAPVAGLVVLVLLWNLFAAPYRIALDESARSEARLNQEVARARMAATDARAKKLSDLLERGLDIRRAWLTANPPPTQQEADDEYIPWLDEASGFLRTEFPDVWALFNLNTRTGHSYQRPDYLSRLLVIMDNRTTQLAKIIELVAMVGIRRSS